MHKVVPWSNDSSLKSNAMNTDTKHQHSLLFILYTVVLRLVSSSLKMSDRFPFLQFSARCKSVPILLAVQIVGTTINSYSVESRS